jgi:hypothetical protein
MGFHAKPATIRIKDDAGTEFTDRFAKPVPSEVEGLAMTQIKSSPASPVLTSDSHFDLPIRKIMHTP